MALPPYIRLNIYAGDDFSFTSEYTGDEDLTSATSLCEFRSTIDSSTVILSVVGTVDAVENTITFELSSSETESLKQTINDCGYSTTYYDTQLTLSDSTVTTTQRGDARTYHDVTRT